MGIHLAAKRLNIKSLTHLGSISPSPSAHKLGSRNTEPKPNPKDKKTENSQLKTESWKSKSFF
jgi:hypothetical protein